MLFLPRESKFFLTRELKIIYSGLIRGKRFNINDYTQELDYKKIAADFIYHEIFSSQEILSEIRKILDYFIIPCTDKILFKCLKNTLSAMEDLLKEPIYKYFADKFHEVQEYECPF